MANINFSNKDLIRLTKIKLNGRQVSMYINYKILTYRLFIPD